MHAPTAVRSAVVGTVLAAIAALASASIVLGKEGGIVTLTAPIPRDAEPGSTVTVEFTVAVETEDGLRPLEGSPIVLSLIGPDGASTEAMSVEAGRPGSYRATIEVPASGISSAVFGLRGSSTALDGTTTVSDIGFAVDGLLFTTANPAPAAAAPQPAESAPGADARLTILGVAVAIGGVLLGTFAFLAGRRRELPSRQARLGDRTG